MNPTIKKRLAFIKYLFNQGIEQSLRPDPLASIALFSFHNSIELFLQLSTEYLNTGNDRINFMEYWVIISKKLKNGEILPQKETMRRLNKARVALKHHGTFPSKLDIEAFKVNTTDFFEQSTPIIFNISFDEVSMIDYIYPLRAKELVKDAEEMLNQNDLERSIDKLVIAFNIIIKDYEQSKSFRYKDSPFSFGRSLTFFKGDDFRINDIDSKFGRKFPDFVDRIKESIEDMQKAIKILALGIDYRRYVKFRLLTPLVHHLANGEFSIVRNNWYPKLNASKEDVEFCIGFIVEVSISLQEFDFNLEIE